MLVSLFCFMFDGLEREVPVALPKLTMKVTSHFNVWLLCSKKERLESVQSDYKFEYFGESQVIYNVMLHRSLLLLTFYRHRQPKSGSGVCCEMQRRRTA